MRAYNRLLFIVLAMTGVFALLQGQDSAAVSAGETKAEVPALAEFHNVIYPLWHTAWPEKNIPMLVELLPEIEKLSANVLQAQLPGILREKQAAWEKGIKELSQIIGEYKAATSPVDSQKLLDAAERLHSHYERLVRTIRPALKELDAFHSVLYMLYHYYLPAWDLNKIRTSVAELQTKMKLLNAAALSKRLQSKSEAFQAARVNLDSSVNALAAVLECGEKKIITDRINSMHSQYEALDKVFQ